MGMFDDIRCETPLPDGTTDVQEFQSKDLDCALDHYRITEGGRLLRLNYRLDEKPDWESWAADGSPLRRTELGWEDTEYHGLLNFYGYPEGNTADWREYVAKFTDGQLQEIAAVPSREEER